MTRLVDVPLTEVEARELLAHLDGFVGLVSSSPALASARSTIRGVLAIDAKARSTSQ